MTTTRMINKPQIQSIGLAYENDWNADKRNIGVTIRLGDNNYTIGSRGDETWLLTTLAPLAGPCASSRLMRRKR